MFAIIELGGSQHKVEKNSIIEVNRVDEKEGGKIVIDQVLLLNDKDKTTVGMPVVDGAKVEAKVIEHFRGEKITVFKMKAKKRYQKTQGHRQELTRLEITDIKA